MPTPRPSRSWTCRSSESQTTPIVRVHEVGRTPRRPAASVSEQCPVMSIFDTFFNWTGLRPDLAASAVGPVDHARRSASRPSSLGLVGGLVLALAAALRAAPRSGSSPSPISTCFRSIPLLVLLIVVYYALPFVGIRLSPFAVGRRALTLVSAAYTAEIFRAGIEAIPQGPVRGGPGARPQSPGRHDDRRRPAAGDQDRHSAAHLQLPSTS